MHCCPILEVTFLFASIIHDKSLVPVFHTYELDMDCSAENGVSGSICGARNGERHAAVQQALAEPHRRLSKLAYKAPADAAALTVGTTADCLVNL